ncbi:MAG: hypothetical protein ACRDRI_22345 [Pseudonocardiaceae bacterium]
MPTSKAGRTRIRCGETASNKDIIEHMFDKFDVSRGRGAALAQDVSDDDRVGDGDHGSLIARAGTDMS